MVLRTFTATLNPMLTLFACIAIGFALKKFNILSKDASSVLSKLQVWVFFPAICFIPMAKYCTVETLGGNLYNLSFSVIALFLGMVIAILISKLFVKQDCYERGIYQFSFTFANNGYVGTPIVQALFSDIGLFYYKLATLPISILMYTWGVAVLTPKENRGANPLKRLINAPLIALVFGVVVGLTGLGKVIYSQPSCAFIVNTLDMLQACMGPNAMIITGIVLASYDLSKMLRKVKFYIATLIRLIGMPIIVLTVIYGLKELINAIFGLDIDNKIVFLLFFATATPFSLNTIIYPNTYNKNAFVSASMVAISHVLFVITIPLLYALITLVLGGAPDFSAAGGI